MFGPYPVRRTNGASIAHLWGCLAKCSRTGIPTGSRTGGTGGSAYLIIGGLAFIYHAKPRYTKKMDLWVDPDPENVARANRALAEFDSPHLLEAGKRDEVLQLGVAPNRIDLLQDPGEVDFDHAWSRRIEGRYDRARVNWVDLDSLIAIKSGIDDPRHQDGARVLRMVRERRQHED